MQIEISFHVPLKERIPEKSVCFAKTMRGQKVLKVSYTTLSFKLFLQFFLCMFDFFVEEGSIYRNTSTSTLFKCVLSISPSLLHNNTQHESLRTGVK